MAFCNVAIPSKLTCIKFGNRRSSFAVASSQSVKVIHVSDDDAKLLYKDDGYDDIIHLARLNDKIIALVRRSNPKQIQFLNVNSGEKIFHKLNFTSSVVNIGFHREFFVVCVENSIFIYRILHAEISIFHRIDTVPENYNGLCALGKYLAYPLSNSGEVICIFDLETLETKTKIKVPEVPVVAIELSTYGDYLAVASETGSLIWVFDTDNAEILWEFRRGTYRCASINCLSFSLDDKFLCCSSNTETVHVFRLRPSNSCYEGDQASWASWATSWSSSLVPTIFQKEKSFAMAHLPCKSDLTVCFIRSEAKEDCGYSTTTYKLLVVTKDGVLYIYEIDKVDGGECRLLTTVEIGGLENDEEITIDGTDDENQEAPLERSNVANNENAQVTFAIRDAINDEVHLHISADENQEASLDSSNEEKNEVSQRTLVNCDTGNDEALIENLTQSKEELKNETHATEANQVYSVLALPGDIEPLALASSKVGNNEITQDTFVTSGNGNDEASIPSCDLSIDKPTQNKGEFKNEISAKQAYSVPTLPEDSENVAPSVATSAGSLNSCYRPEWIETEDVKQASKTFQTLYTLDEIKHNALPESASARSGCAEPDNFMQVNEAHSTVQSTNYTGPNSAEYITEWPKIDEIEQDNVEYLGSPANSFLSDIEYMAPPGSVSAGSSEESIYKQLIEMNQNIHVWDGIDHYTPPKSASARTDCTVPDNVKQVNEAHLTLQSSNYTGPNSAEYMTEWPKIDETKQDNVEYLASPSYSFLRDIEYTAPPRPVSAGPMQSCSRSEWIETEDVKQANKKFQKIYTWDEIEHNAPPEPASDRSCCLTGWMEPDNVKQANEVHSALRFWNYRGLSSAGFRSESPKEDEIKQDDGDNLASPSPSYPLIRDIEYTAPAGPVSAGSMQSWPRSERINSENVTRANKAYQSRSAWLLRDEIEHSTPPRPASGKSRWSYADWSDTDHDSDETDDENIQSKNGDNDQFELSTRKVEDDIKSLEQQLQRMCIKAKNDFVNKILK